MAESAQSARHEPESASTTNDDDTVSNAGPESDTTTYDDDTVSSAGPESDTTNADDDNGDDVRRQPSAVH